MLRRKMLTMIDNPIVMETHGRAGKIYQHCYAHLKRGVVIEKDPTKADILGKQRPTWAVYQADCVVSVREGLGSHLNVNVLDLDPYGESWPVLNAFFESKRQFPKILAIVVNDGLRQKIQLGGAWNVKSLRNIVTRYGNNLYHQYLDICQLMLQEKAATVGYSLSRFAGYYCGGSDNMTHFLAILEQPA